jgi:predicted MPP superfamily phosphohydrolase
MIGLSIATLLFVVGHLAVWCTLFNQIHATRCPRSARKGSELLTLLNVGVLGGAAAYMLLVYPNWLHPQTLWQAASVGWQSLAALGSSATELGAEAGPWSSHARPTGSSGPLYVLAAYWHGCCLLSFFFIVRWIFWQMTIRRPDFFVEENLEFYDMEDEDPELLNGLPAQLIHALLPGSQLLVLSVEFKTFEFPHLPAAFDGYRISHLSDLHFTGRIGKAYFRQVFERCLQWDPHLICITGDLIDKTKCLDWIEELLGELQAPDGVYFILGNHDRRIKNEVMLRSRLADCGLTDANGRYWSIERCTGHRAARLWLAGNELPWYGGAEKLEPVDTMRTPQTDDFFVALSHSPDQWPWAKRMGFDLMLAGHTHGGQVCLPIIGPIVAPSRFGVRYAGGVFQVGSMAMQVSRGISGAEPLRWNCPPELCQLTLRRGNPGAKPRD